MPFKSKAQQRFMFATNPEKAKEWASETKSMKSLPEKKHPQVNPQKKNLPPMREKTAGLFFEKRSQPHEGHFFRDLQGRDDANFHEKSAMTSYAPGQIPSGGGADVSPAGGTMYGTGSAVDDKSSEIKADTMDAGATGAPIGGMGQRGEGMGGGSLYGSGEGSEEEASPEDTLKALLGKAVAEGDEQPQKTAAKSPNDWDADAGLPTGFHRPAGDQPEALEAGGERFHSTEHKGADFGVGHGLVETGSFKMKGTSSGQMGKHASAPLRFLGTSYGIDKEATWSEDQANRFVGSARSGIGSIGEAAKKGVESVTSSPAASLIALALLGRAGLRGGKAGLKGAKKAINKARGVHPPPPPPTAVEKLMAGAKNIGAKLGITTK